MTDKHIELHLPVPWSDRPAVLSVSGTAAVAIICVCVLVAVIAYRIL